MTEIEKNLTDYIKRECLSKNNERVPQLNDDLFEAGIVDSAGLISFISFLEIEYKIVIPDEDLLPENFKSIAAISGYLNSRIKR